jgi:putative ABC transport system permease protein
MKIFRKLKNDFKWSLINTIGLSIAMACTLIVFLYCRQQFSFDRFHSKADRIYRITFDSNQGATSIHPARSFGDQPKQFMNEYPAIEKMTRLVPYRNAIIKIGQQIFYSQNAYSTDSSFFDIFDFKILSGNSQNSFTKPGHAFISRALAMKYFGTFDVAGKEISITHQQDPASRNYAIDGVMEDFPVNSHFHADLLTSFNNEGDHTTWAYTYYLLSKGTDADALKKMMQKKLKAENKSEERVPIVYLQKLKDIHLYSHKTREMENNGDIRTIILLISCALIILVVALMNFLNLSRVRFISELKTINVKLINGASRGIVAGEIILDSAVLSVVSGIGGLLAASWLGSTMQTSVFQPEMIPEIVLFIFCFAVIVMLLSIIPYFTLKQANNIKLNSRQERLYKFPMVLQYTLAIVVITCTFVLYRQMEFINSKHPASKNANMVVIGHNPWEAVQRYDVFKTELLKNSSVKNITAAMEEPGGDILDAVGFEMEGIEKKENSNINIFTIDPNFFISLGIHPLAGTTEPGYTPSQQWETDAIELDKLRTEKSTDNKKIAELEKKVENYHEKYILNESALILLGIKKPEDAIGKRFRINFFIPELFQEGEVIGVVPDFHYTNLHSEEKPLVIAPRKMFNYCFLISIDPNQRSRAITAIALTWKEINPEFPFQYEYITDSYQKIYAAEYTETKVLSLFAIISVILSSLGIFSLASFSIERRVKEIGIRKVNGAGISEILAMLNGDFIKWVAVAFVVATPVAWYFMHKWLANFAYKTSLSWWIFALSGLLALGIALLTVSLQSWRAATRNPVEALRYG